MRRGAIVIATLILLGMVVEWSRAPTRAASPVAAEGGVVPLSPEDDAMVAVQRQQQCTKCHVLPPPEYVPRGMWRFRVQEMAERSMMGTGIPPGEQSLLWQLDLDKIARWYEMRAPDVLPLPEPWPEGDGGLRFQPHVYNPPGDAPSPVVSNVRFYDLDGNGRLEIVVCDMGRGSIFVGDPAKSPGVLRQVAVLLNPAHAEMVDLDRDGKQDLLIADLGEFLPADHEKGSVVWLRQTAPFVFEKKILVEGIARTADARAADFDGDGDLDLVVAAYGWHRVGGTLFYENQTTSWQEPKFVESTIDARPGPIHVPAVDLNDDGRLDVVDLVAQQYEHVVAYINRGPGKGFRQETVFRAVTPVWGSSGIQTVDMDGDEDLDVLMTNGDTLDDFTIRPFHGIRWFENEGDFPFTPHELVAMPGAHRAQAIDMDGDGDLDVVACAFLPDAQHPQFQHMGRQGDLSKFTSLGWLERVGPKAFRPHPLKLGNLTHVTLDAADYDQDGDVDILFGNFVGFTFGKSDTGFKTNTWVELWENTAGPLEGD